MELVLAFLLVVVAIWMLRNPKYAGFGLAIFALLALFMGGCSIIVIRVGVLECWGKDFNSQDCSYAGIFPLLGIPSLAAALLLALFVWRRVKGLPIDYRWILAPFAILMGNIGITLIAESLVKHGRFTLPILLFWVPALLVTWRLTAYRKHKKVDEKPGSDIDQ